MLEMPIVAGAGGGVGASTVASALGAVDAGLYRAGQPVHVLVCRLTMASTAMRTARSPRRRPRRCWPWSPTSPARASPADAGSAGMSESLVPATVMLPYVSGWRDVAGVGVGGGPITAQWSTGCSGGPDVVSRGGTCRPRAAARDRIALGLATAARSGPASSGLSECSPRPIRQVVQTGVPSRSAPIRSDVCPRARSRPVGLARCSTSAAAAPSPLAPVPATAAGTTRSPSPAGTGPVNAPTDTRSGNHPSGEVGGFNRSSQHQYRCRARGRRVAVPDSRTRAS